MMTVDVDGTLPKAADMGRIECNARGRLLQQPGLCCPYIIQMMTMDDVMALAN